MIILFENSFKHAASFNDLNISKLCIVRYEKPLTSVKQIVVEDLGYSREVLTRSESIKYMYSLAESYSHRFKLDENEYVFILNGSSGFDLGFSLYLINKICNTIRRPSILLIAEIPRLNTRIDVRARFISWLKTIFLHDIIVNNNGLMKIVLTDPDPPSQLVKYLVLLLSSSLSNDFKSLVHVKLKRFVLPLAEIYYLLQLFTLHGRFDYLIEDYKRVLFLIHRTLDQAPTDLWSVARKSTSLIRGSIYSYMKLIDLRDKLVKAMSDLVGLLIKNSKFTESVVDPRELVDKLLTSHSVSEIHNDVFNDERIVNYLNISSDLLVDTYTAGYLDKCSYTRFVLIGSDLSDRIPRGNNVVKVESIFNELSVFDLCSVSINSDCKYNTSYIPFSFIEAYTEASALNYEVLYPRELFILNTVIKPIDIHSVCLVNYNGFKKAVNEKCLFSGLKLLKNITESIG
ncbi:MAG: hypothetical protein QXX35_03700 [Desulfurococcaceae archaeon]